MFQSTSQVVSTVRDVSRGKLQPDEVSDFLSTVAYEAEVLAWSAHRAGQLEEAAEVERDYCAAIDRSVYVNASWAAARNLLLFFADKDWNGRAVVARDFVVWDPVPGSEALGIADDRVLHVAFRRVRKPRTMELADVLDDIDRRMKEFFRRLPPHLKSKFHESLADALAAVTLLGKRR